MPTSSRPYVWFALLIFLFGLACNPLSSLTALVDSPTATPVSSDTSPAMAQPTDKPHVAVFPTAPRVPASPTAPVFATAPVLATVAAQPIQFAERTVHVDALNVREGPPASGGTNAVDVRVRPVVSTGSLHVGFVETGVGAIGAQWHASGWVAVLLGSMMLGVDPTNYEFYFTNQGYIDGPSAGGLMTVAVLAALRGDTPRPDATMTGTVNPDGTIGPVGGIPHKLQGAVAKGKKLVLVPIGQRYDLDMNTKQMVDLVSTGQTLGLEVREVGNVYDAYAAIVGKPLPRPVVSAGTPQFPNKAFDAIKTKLGDWYKRYDDERNQYNRLSASTRNWLAKYVEEQNALASQSIKDLNQGLVGLAYFEITTAASNMRTANIDGQLTERYARGFDTALDYLLQLTEVGQDLDAALKTLQSQQPNTVSDLVGLFDAYSSLGAGEGLIISAEGRITSLKNRMSKLTQDQILDELIDIGEDMGSAGNYIQMALDTAQFESGYGSTPVPKQSVVAAVADTLSQAGEANLALFESTIIGPTAKEVGLTNESVKGQLLDKDGDYRVAVLAGIGEGELYGRMSSGIHRSAMVFGNAQNVYAFSASLIAKHYSLGAKMDKDLKVTGYSNAKALGEMLDFADQRTRELIGLCGSETPVAAILYYENAHTLRQGSAADQLTALNYYWQAVALAQADAFMAGKFTVK